MRRAAVSIANFHRVEGSPNPPNWRGDATTEQTVPQRLHVLIAPMQDQPSVDPGGPDEWLATIGDISVSEYWISTPAGQFPIPGTVWTVTDMSVTEEHFPTTAIVLAIVFSLVCLLGLLFLVMMKEVRQVGFVQVMVQGDGFCYSTSVPVTHPQDVLAIYDEVEYARELAAQLT